MEKSRLIFNIKNIYKKSAYVFIAAVIALANVTPAMALPAFTSHSISSQYRDPTGVVSTDGSLWYIEKGLTASDYWTIGRMTPSGATTDYDIRALSGNANLKLASLTAGLDGNIWFIAYYTQSVYVGKLDIAAGTVAITSSPISTYGNFGRIVTDSDGRLWYYVKSANNNKTYLNYVDPSSLVHATAHMYDTYANFRDIASGSDGKVWLVDQYYKRIYTRTGVAGGSGSSFNFPSGVTSVSGLTAGSDGNLWFAANNKYFTRAPAGTFTEFTPPAGVSIGALAVGSDGAMWFSDNSSTKKIGRVTTSGDFTTYNIPGTNIGNIPTVTVGSDKAVWFAYKDSAGSKLGRFVAEPILSSHPISTSYGQPSQMTAANGSLWYVQSDASGNNSIGNMMPSGDVVANHAIMPIGASSMKVTRLATGSDGNVWFTGCSSSNSSNWTVEAGRLDVTTGAVTFYTNSQLGSTLPVCTGSAMAAGPITAGPDGKMWYAIRAHLSTTKNSYLFSIDPITGTTVQGWTANSGSLGFSSMVTGSDGRLWATNSTVEMPHDMHAFTITGNNAVISGTYTTGNSPRSVVVGSDGNLWFASGAGVSKMTTSGVLTQYSLGNRYASSLAAGSDGAIWFISQNNGDSWIGRMTTAGSMTQYDTLVSNNYPMSIVAGSDNAMWFSYFDQTAPGVYSLGRAGF